MKNLAKKLITIVLALAVLAGTLFIESGSKIEAVTALEQDVMVVTDEQGATFVRDGESEMITGERLFEPGNSVQTSNNQTAVIRFDDAGVMRLAPLTVLTFQLQSEEGYVFQLKQGQAWMNDLSTSSRVNVVAGGAVLVPRHASFDIRFDGQTTEVRVFSSQVNVGLVTDKYAMTSVAGPQDESFVNGFLVAQGSRAVISLTKVVENANLLRQLLYSKLIKEFQYSLMDPAALAEDNWVIQNKAVDKALRADTSASKEQELTSRGLHYASLDALGYELDKVIISLSDRLTFTEEKRTERLVDGLFEQLLDAEYLLAFGRDAEAKERLVLFDQFVTEGLNNRGELFEEQVFQKIRRSYADLRYVLPTDSLYDAKVMLSDLLIEEFNGSETFAVEKLGLIRDYMNYAYALADTNQLAARLALENYFSRFQKFVEQQRQFLGNMALLPEENQIMDNLLRQYPEFYQESFFAMKDFLEEESLKLLPEGPDKDEERQTIISAKIDFLKRLQTFFLDEEVSLTDARLIAFRLINEIQDLQPGSDIGVSNLFALRLQDYGTFLKFLNTTNVSQLRGSSPQSAYDSFLALQKEQLSVEQVIQEFLGEEVTTPTVSVEEILAQVAEDFEKIKVENLQVAPVSDPSQESVQIISANLGDVSFSGSYEWKRKLISNVRSGGRLLSQNAIRLSSLVLLLTPEEETVTPPEEEVTPPEQVSQAERVAKILLLQKLNQNGISAEEQNVVVRDLDAGDFVVNGAVLVDNKNVQMAFAFQNKTNTVSSLVVRTPSGDLRAGDSYSVANLATVARQIYDQGTLEEDAGA